MKKSTTLAVVIAIIAIGIFYSNKNNTPETEETTPNTPETTLLTDTARNISIVTTQQCVGQFGVTLEELTEDDAMVASYLIFPTQSETWPENTAWFSFSLYTKEAFDTLEGDELIDKPTAFLKLDEYTIVRSSPQDQPEGLPDGCGMDSVMIK